MLKWINNKRNKKGFTLVELVVVVAILGIVAAIAVPKLTESRGNAANSAHNANVRTLESAATMYIAEKGVPATTAVVWTKAEPKTSLDYLQKWPDVPKGAKTKTGTGIDSEVYKVTIGIDGTVGVTPVSIDLDTK